MQISIENDVQNFLSLLVDPLRSKGIEEEIGIDISKAGLLNI